MILEEKRLFTSPENTWS